MTPEQIRLECLRLVHRHDHTAEQVTARAKSYEAYVSGDTAKAPSAAKAKKGAAKAAT